MGFAIFQYFSVFQYFAVGTYGKSLILIKRARSYSFSFEFYLYLLLSLTCVIPFYLYYALLGQTLNLLSFLIRSKINNLTEFCLSLQFLWIIYFALRLLHYGDIELNPGPKYFSICHWSINSLTAHNYLKVSQLQAFNLVRKFDILCISETHLSNFQRMTMHCSLKDTL